MYLPLIFTLSNTLFNITNEVPTEQTYHRALHLTSFILQRQRPRESFALAVCLTIPLRAPSVHVLFLDGGWEFCEYEGDCRKT